MQIIAVVKCSNYGHTWKVSKDVNENKYREKRERGERENHCSLLKHKQSKKGIDII